MKALRNTVPQQLCLLACLISPMAVTAAEPGIYGGLNLGLTSSRIDKTHVTDGLLPVGFTYTNRRADTRDVGFKLFAGYQFTPYFALETGYFDLGSYNNDVGILPAGNLLSDTAVKGFNFDAVFTMPVTESFDVFARAGMINGRVESDYYGSGYAATATYPSGHRRDTHEKFGVGVAYELNDQVSVRVEAERYNFLDATRRDGNINLYSVGLVYSFGKKKPAPVVAAPAPAPAPVVAAPAPTPAPAPAPTITTLSADSFFEFDSAVLMPAGERELDQLVTSLRGAEFETIAVTGYTDRLGKADYNLNLSRRRAEAVKAYLVQSARIPASKISAQGRNGSSPVTTMTQCPGTVATAQLKACLQPDRRVEVEVTAKR